MLLFFGSTTWLLKYYLLPPNPCLVLPLLWGFSAKILYAFHIWLYMTHILNIQILLGCDTVALGVQFLVSAVPSSCASCSWRVPFHPKAKAQHSFQTSGTTHPMTASHPSSSAFSAACLILVRVHCMFLFV